MSDAISRLGLGTVQFGLAYGATNARGKVSIDMARFILSDAAAAGMRILDTAAAYGDSEEVLGSLAAIACSFRIVTKTSPLPGDRLGEVELEQVRASLARSRRRLARPRLDAVLVHHSGDLLRPGADRLLGLLREAKAAGEIGKIGVSVYDPPELAAVLDRFLPDLVQLPVNLLDQRFAASGMLHALKASGVEIHARSLFLQGTLLVEPAAVPRAARAGMPAFHEVARFLAASGLSRLQACLAYGMSLPEIDCLILGVTGRDELAEILAAVRGLPATPPDFSPLAVADERVVNPARWHLAGD